MLIARVPEIWGGMECTVNRVGGRYFDQIAATRHDRYDDDLDLFAGLGIRTLRQPILWEHVMPALAGGCRWEWSDRRMARLRTLGIRPVVGLMHHGSGPRYTSLVDPRFPEHFERYAAAVAERFPWTPFWILLNEPLTTARFSCLYGHWYPHVRDDRLFARAIIGQCVAIARAAAAVRRVNPETRLIQSEDLGKAFSTPLLTYQAEMENERRWLTFDLLSGRVRPGHIMWEWLRRAGADLDDLAWLADHPSPPDCLGINHYLTSERFLDERTERYPPRRCGRNAYHSYADVEAVRVCAEGPAGIAALLTEAWHRYRIPMVITETHLDCSRDEQLRWLTEVRQICEDLSQDGVSIVALTVWSLLGSYNWHELMTTDGDYYESGVFDIRGGDRRKTRLADVVRCWTAGRRFDHPVLDGAGWWHRDVRLLYPPVIRGGITAAVRPQPPVQRRHILVVGATRIVQREFERAAHLRDLAIRFINGDDLASAANAADTGADDMWAVVFAGLIGEFREGPNANWPLSVARMLAFARCAAAKRCHVTLLSSQQVFGTVRARPYLETDEPNPSSVHGRLVMNSELSIRAAVPRVLIARAALCFADRDHYHHAPSDVLSHVPHGSDATTSCSLTYLPDFVRYLLDLIIDGECGVWHLPNLGRVTLRDVMTLAGRADPAQVWSATAAATVAAYALESVHGPVLPAVSQALDRAGYGSSVAPSSISASR